MCCNGFSRKINLFKYKTHFKGYSKHELSTINMSSVSEKNYRITSLPHHLSTTATFLRPQGGRCREVRLCSVRTPKQLLLFIATAITLTFHREQILQTSDYNFFRERKAHVMTPHNTGLTGGRDDLPLRFRARTFPQLLQYCLRLETGFLIGCFILHLLLDFISGVSLLLGPLSPNLSLTNWLVLTSRRCNLWTGLRRRPFCVLRVTVRTRPSFPGTNLSTRPIAHLPLDTLSSEISNTSPILSAGCSHTHLYLTDNWCRYCPRQRCQKWVRSFCWYRYRRLVVPSCVETSSGKLYKAPSSARWAGVMGVRSLTSSLTVVSGLELKTASILVSTVVNSW